MDFHLSQLKSPHHKMGASKNNGTPKSSQFRVFHYINHPFWGFSPYFWKHPNVEIALGFQAELVQLHAQALWMLPFAPVLDGHFWMTAES